MERQALWIAVAEAPDFRFGASVGHEGIVRRHRAIGLEANDLAEMVGEVLRLVAVREMLAEREEEIIIASLHDAAAEVITTRERTILMEDDGDVGERALLH